MQTHYKETATFLYTNYFSCHALKGVNTGFAKGEALRPLRPNSSRSTTGGPSSSCDMIILRNNRHGGIIRVCMGIFTAALRNKIIRQILKKNTSPYFYSVTLVIWPLTLMKRTHFSELSISTFSTFIRKAQGWTLHFRTPDPRSEKSKLRMTGRPQSQRRIQANIL